MTEQRPDRVVIYRDAGGDFRWRRIAPNGELISEGGEGYTRAGDASKAARRVNGEGVDYDEEPG